MEDTTSYDKLIEFYIELRGHGHSLSAIELESFLQWQENKINADFIAKIMLEVREEYQAKNKEFPSTLGPVKNKLNRVLLKSREV